MTNSCAIFVLGKADLFSTQCQSLVYSF